MDVEQLTDERLKLLQAHYAGAVPLDLLRVEQQRIAERLDSSERKLARLRGELDDPKANLDRALDYLVNIATAYKRGTPQIRRKMNQALFDRVKITDDEEATATLKQPSAGLVDESLRATARLRRSKQHTRTDAARPRASRSGCTGALLPRTGPPGGGCERSASGGGRGVLAQDIGMGCLGTSA